MHSPLGHGDITEYHRDAQAFWFGSPPLRALPAEYPILALVPMTLTLLPPLHDFVSVYGLWLLLALIAGLLALRRIASRRAAEVLGAYLVVGCFATVLGRFDLLPAAATVAAYWAAREQRFRLAYVVLAVGTLLKLYPLLLLPIIVIEQYRALGAPLLSGKLPRPVLNGVALFAGLVVAGFAVSAALNPGGWLGPFTFNGQRPLQVESVPASLLWLSGLLGLTATPDHSFHTYNLVGDLSRPLSMLTDIALIAGCAAVYWWRLTNRLSLGNAITLCLLIIICTDHVFSPQYLIWVLPMLALMEPNYDPLWLAICALTSLIFPIEYQIANLHGVGAPSSYPLWFTGAIAARNALLVLATVRFARQSLLVIAERTPPAPAPRPRTADLR